MTDDERWSRDMATLRRAAEEFARRRNGLQQQRVVSPFEQIAQALDDPSPQTREAAVRELYELDPDRAATLVNDALRDGSLEERRRIGTALADSGLLYEAIQDLKAENYESCYGAFSLLFLVAKAGVVEPLFSVIENNPSTDLSLALLRLLASSREPEVLSAFRRLADNASLSLELRRVAVESLAQLNAHSSAA
jgi:hypothetical protein